MRKLRHATFILPRTGERVRRVFSLPSLYESNGTARDEAGNAEEQESLMGHSEEPISSRRGFVTRFYRARDATVNFWSSATGQGILRCSLAYLVGSLATFVPFVSHFLGKQDGKHVVATVTVYFHPSRTVGSMLEAVAIATVAFCYAAFIAFTSMGVSMLLGQRGLLVLGHAIVLVVFCAGGLGFIAWIKQRLGHPTVNVGCSLASLAIITVMTKEGAIQAAKFSEDKVVQVLKMVILGMAATTAVNLLVKPRFARTELTRDMIKVTDLFGDKLIAITRAFLSGTEDELKSGAYKRINKDFATSSAAMSKNLKEARWEHYALGTERRYAIEAKLVRCLQQLSQNMGGLHSAAATQFSFLRTSQKSGKQDSTTSSTFASPQLSSEATFGPGFQTRPTLESISEVAEDLIDPPNSTSDPEVSTTPAPTDSSEDMSNTTMSNSMVDSRQPLSPADMFTTFIKQLGPPLKSLAYTLKQILDELQFEPNSNQIIAVNSNFRSSLALAIELFSGARRDALSTLYRNKDISNAKSLERVADLEEVAASCGHFAAAMIDFAEDVLVYIELLEELKEEMQQEPLQRSWWWLAFWRRWTSKSNPREETIEATLQGPHDIEALSTDIAKPIKRADLFAKRGTEFNESISRRVYRILRVFRRDDVRFAIKVGVGAALFALPSFLAVTRPFYSHWRGEWGLVSYMVVCSMTIGASNTTGVERFMGTGLGALFAIIAWIVADENPWILGFFGWICSVVCFYIILSLGKGPMGRFILLTYNLSALYAYSLSAKDNDDDDDEGGINPEIWEIVLHRVISVIAGCIWGIVVTRVFWPISARRKLKQGICVLWLRMSLIWRRDPLAMFLLGEPASSYMDIREEAELQTFLHQLDALRIAAASEFELRAPFPDKVTKSILEHTQRMLDNFHAMNVVISKDLKASPGEAEVLRYTRAERFELSALISHLFSVLASSIKLEYPLNDVLPNVDHTRDRLLAKIFEFRRDGEMAGLATEEDYELLYAYGEYSLSSALSIGSHDELGLCLRRIECYRVS